MIIKLTEKELQNLKIEYIGRRTLSADYIRDRDLAWGDLVESGKKVGKSIWNGELYTFERFIQYDQENLTIELGSCDYSGRLFKKKIGFHKIEEIYGKDHLQIHCGVNCFPITTDNKLVVGMKKASVDLRTNVYAFISGNLNKDEKEVLSFSDITTYIKKEIEEESSLIVDINKLKFHQINHFNTYFNFEFTYQLDISSDEVHTLNKDDEFISFIAMGADELLNLDAPMISDLEYSKNYIATLLSD